MQLVRRDLLEDAWREMGDKLEELGNVGHHELWEGGKEAWDLVREGQALGWRVGDRDEPARDEAIVPHAHGDEVLIG